PQTTRSSLKNYLPHAVLPGQWWDLLIVLIVSQNRLPRLSKTSLVCALCRSIPVARPLMETGPTDVLPKIHTPLMYYTSLSMPRPPKQSLLTQSVQVSKIFSFNLMSTAQQPLRRLLQPESTSSLIRALQYTDGHAQSPGECNFSVLFVNSLALKGMC